MSDARLIDLVSGFERFADYQTLRGNHHAATDAREDLRRLLESVALNDPNAEVPW